MSHCSPIIKNLQNGCFFVKLQENGCKMALKQEITKKILNDIIILRNAGRFEEAIELAMKSFRNTKNNCFNNEIYNCFISQNKRSEAIKILIKMIKYEPDNLSLKKKLAHHYFLLGDYKNALKYYKKVTDYEPAKPENQYNTGMMYHYLKDRQKAYQHYRNALNINPKYTPALNNIGLLYFESNDFENAVAIFKKTVSSAPSSPEAYHHLGVIQRVYYNDEELSLLYLKKAIRLDPEYADNYYQLALTYNKYGRKQETITTLQKCLELCPQHNQAKQLLGKITENKSL